MVTVFYGRHSKEWWGLQEDGQLAQIINTFIHLLLKLFPIATSLPRKFLCDHGYINI